MKRPSSSLLLVALTVLLCWSAGFVEAYCGGNNNKNYNNNQNYNNANCNQQQYSYNNYQQQGQNYYYQQNVDSQDPDSEDPQQNYNNNNYQGSTTYYGDQYYSYGYPKLGADACYAYDATNICNPDRILTQSDTYYIEHDIYNFEDVNVYCKSSQISVQLAVYVEHFTKSHSPEQIAAKLHTDWGLGIETACGNSGLLIYVPIDGGHVYISRGNALRDALPDTVLRYVIANMRNYMSVQNYVGAIRYGIQDLTSYLRGEKSSPGYFAYGYSQLTSRIPPQVVCGGAIAVLLGVVLVCVQGCRHQKKRAQIKDVEESIEEANMYTFDGNDMVVKNKMGGGTDKLGDQLNTTMDAEADEYYEEAGRTHGW